MTRGNQRDKAREKTAKKQKEAQKRQSANSRDGNKGMSLEERRERDAAIMRQKQEQKKGPQEEGAVGGAAK